MTAFLCPILSGCAAVANPWKEWNTLEEAEAAVGYTLDMSEKIEDSYTAKIFRTLTGSETILEVIYSDEDSSVTVRKSPGEGRDISGVTGYDLADSVTVPNGYKADCYRPQDAGSDPNGLKVLFDHDGYSCSFFVPKGFWGDSASGFLIEAFTD